jgi:flagellar basal body-associated protein FliL
MASTKNRMKRRMWTLTFFAIVLGSVVMLLAFFWLSEHLTIMRILPERSSFPAALASMF